MRSFHLLLNIVDRGRRACIKMFSCMVNKKPIFYFIKLLDLEIKSYSNDACIKRNYLILSYFVQRINKYQICVEIITTQLKNIQILCCLIPFGLY